MEILKKLVDQSIEDIREKGHVLIDLKLPEEIKEWEDKLCHYNLLVDRSRLESLLKENLEKIKNQKEIIKILLEKLTEVAQEKVKEISDIDCSDKIFIDKAIEAVSWDYFFDIDTKRRIIDYIISEDKTRKP